MSDDRPKKDDEPLDQLDKLEAEIGDYSPRERFEKTSKIALLLAYDLIDKLRYWERDSLALPDDQIEERLGHLNESVKQIRTAYLTFSDLDL